MCGVCYSTQKEPELKAVAVRMGGRGRHRRAEPLSGPAHPYYAAQSRGRLQ